jgi:4-diphosphocytidyl-2-C-methyl-D-erythritol kinase
VLVNPGVALSTRDVFARMGLEPSVETGFGAHPEIEPGMGLDALIRALTKGRNDMEDAAIMLAPRISDVLAVLIAARGCRLARMSGSGATCFGLFEDCRAAAKAAKVIARDHPGWWAKATALR